MDFVCFFIVVFCIAAVCLACVAGARKGKGEGKIGRARETRRELPYKKDGGGCRNFEKNS